MPSFRDLSKRGTKPASPMVPALQADSLSLSHQGGPYEYVYVHVQAEMQFSTNISVFMDHIFSIILWPHLENKDPVIK